MRLILAFAFATVIGVEKRPVPFATPPIDYCYEPLNPVEKAKAGKMAVDTFFACKSELVNLNVKPGIILESNSFCVGCRICYILAEERTKNRKDKIKFVFDCADKLANAGLTYKPYWLQKYKYNHTAASTAYRRCGSKYMPQDGRVMLFGLRWLRDIVSG
ncbi:uncharacterized protein LOC144167412 [Haemaphysalis longicornis]